MAEEAGIFKKVSTRYELPDGTKVFGKSINNEPEKYFTDEVLKKIDEHARQNSPTEQTKSKRYVFAQKEGEDHTCIKLTEGKYKDIIYKYGKVGIPPEVEEDEQGRLPFTFDYTVVRNPNDLDLLDNPRHL